MNVTMKWPRLGRNSRPDCPAPTEAVIGPQAMKRFLKRLAVFAAPFVLYMVVILLVDPYNFFNVSHVMPNELKKPVSHLNYPLWKMIEYRRQPVPNVLLGDSRMNAISTETVRRITGQNYYNFAYGGASLEEMIRTFWFADSHARLRNVYFGISFYVYNQSANGDRTDDYRRINKHPLLYFVSPSVVEGTWYDILRCLGGEVEIGLPDMSPERFWEYQLQTTASERFRRYQYPNKYREELARIATHCRTNGIRLVFVIFPTHTDLQQLVRDFHLASQESRFLHDVAQLAPTLDYNFPNDITIDRSNFKDPFHFRKELMKLLVEDIWGHQETLPRRTLNLDKGSSLVVRRVKAPNILPVKASRPEFMGGALEHALGH